MQQTSLSQPTPLNDMGDEDRDAAKIIQSTFGTGGDGNGDDDPTKKDKDSEEFSFVSIIVKDGRWAKALAKALSE